MLALSLGALSFVQPLLVTTLLFAVPLGRAHERRRIRPPDLAAAAAVVGCLAIFEATAAPSAGRTIADSTVRLVCAAAVLAVCATAPLPTS